MSKSKERRAERYGIQLHFQAHVDGSNMFSVVYSLEFLRLLSRFIKKSSQFVICSCDIVTKCHCLREHPIVIVFV